MTTTEERSGSVLPDGTSALGSLLLPVLLVNQESTVHHD